MRKTRRERDIYKNTSLEACLTPPLCQTKTIRAVPSSSHRHPSLPNKDNGGLYFLLWKSNNYIGIMADLHPLSNKDYIGAVVFSWFQSLPKQKIIESVQLNRLTCENKSCFLLCSTIEFSRLFFLSNFVNGYSIK